MNATEVLQTFAATLERFGITYMLTGSFASAFYGASRSTQDIDFVIETSPERLQAFAGYLEEEHYYIDVNAALDALQRRTMFNVIDVSRGCKIDLIIRKERPFSKEEFRRRRRVDFNGAPMFVASAEDIVIAKMEWAKMSGSARQLDDVAAILRSRWNDVDRGYLENWTASLDLKWQWEEVRKRSGVQSKDHL